MDKFQKITEELYEEKEGNIEDSLCVDVMHTLKYSNADHYMLLQQAVIDCESPIEQLLAIDLERINLTSIALYNPFVDVVAIEKQAKVKCKDATYRVDFLIPVIYKNQGEIWFVVECDGHEFHQKTKEQVERDNTRTRDLQKAGYEVIRFSGTEIWHRSYRCALEVLKIILSKCKYTEEE